MVLYFQYNHKNSLYNYKMYWLMYALLFLLRKNTGCFNVLRSHLSNVVWFHFSLVLSIRYCIIRQFSVLPMKYYCRWWFIDYFQCLFFSSPNTLPITLSPTLDRGLPITLSPTLDRGLSITLSPTLDRG